MSVSYWQNTVGFGDGLNTDVLIIGAGIAGLSAAYWLHKKDPTLSLAVIDKGGIGTGASGRNAGFITCGSTEYFSRMVSAYGEDKADQIWKFTEDNHRMLLTEFGADQLESRCDYKQRGSWTLAITEQEAKTIQDSLEDLKKRGVQAEWYSTNYVASKLQCERFVGGAKYPKDGEVHPIKLLYHIASYLKAIPIIENREVFRIDEKNGRLLVTGRNIEIITDSIVLATNAYSNQLFAYFEDKVFPTRGQIIVTEPVPQFLEPCYCSFALDYFRQLPDGRILIGGFRNTDVEKEVGFSDEINPIVHGNLEKFLENHFPLLRGVPIEYRWSGVMGFAKDGYPMVGSLPQDPRIFFAGGFTGHGLGYAFKMGKVLADLMLEGKDPGIFAARRFQ
jgi:glycine/D-amino acid oxidase-like deaminating enzyme